MWGILRPVDIVGGYPGITPTCVGNTALSVRSKRDPRDHPHVCGEYTPDEGCQQVRWGSPPRVWGIPTKSTAPAGSKRITPTCVGNTDESLFGKALLEDHPHVCGEYLKLMTVPVYGSGSPPRVWGILQHLFSGLVSDGITPTCVGNTIVVEVDECCQEDHPHVCGEYVDDLLEALAQQGSPPRVWGILSGVRLAPVHVRITPTCVGNTHRHHLAKPVLQDHPHVCGEYAVTVVSYAHDLGSPPRVWGIPRLGYPVDLITGDHPHVCGEYGLEGGCGFACLGITPTCVGNTIVRKSL